MSPETIKIHSFYIESLGCPKNSVDSRSIAELLIADGKSEANSPESADLILVNTCGFIQPAVAESLQVLKDFSELKKKNQILIAAGCLSEREKSEIFNLVPGLDGALGTRRWSEILRLVNGIEKGDFDKFEYLETAGRILDDPPGIIRAANFGGSAYLKIADGCDRGCAFCAIPSIKGPMVSRPIQDVIGDARILAENSVKEIILIAQDITAYGNDLGLREGIINLLHELVQLKPKITWIRLMYTFPGAIPDELIQLMASEKQILNYLDIPLQHAHPKVLKRMRRPADMKSIQEKLSEMRKQIPELAIRTTFIVGFPGETEEEFSALCHFIEEVRFDHVGFFPYYHESGTPASSLENLPFDLKEQRIQELAALQENISLQKNQELVGKTLDVLIEGSGDDISVGRSYRDAPEVDGLVLINGTLDGGKIIPVEITGAMVHDLTGKPN